LIKNNQNQQDIEFQPALRTALLVIDVQQGLFAKSTPVYEAEALLENINALAERAHQAGAPVFYIQHSDQKALAFGSEAWQLHSQLHPESGDCIIHKQHGNAFEATDLGSALKANGVGAVVVAGLVTHGCVRATALGARALGYRVILAQDGHSSFSKQAAQLIVEWNEKLGQDTAEVKPTAEIDF
jgi:aminoglycoside 6'-N-acetyltransferase